MGNGNGSMGGGKLENTLLGLEGVRGLLPRSPLLLIQNIPAPHHQIAPDGRMITGLFASRVLKHAF